MVIFFVEFVNKLEEDIFTEKPVFFITKDRNPSKERQAEGYVLRFKSMSRKIGM